MYRDTLTGPMTAESRCSTNIVGVDAGISSHLFGPSKQMYTQYKYNNKKPRVPDKTTCAATIGRLCAVK